MKNYFYATFFSMMLLPLTTFAVPAATKPAAAPAAGLAAPKKGVAEELSKKMLPIEQYNQLIEAIVQNGLQFSQARIESEGKKVDFNKEKAKIEKNLRDSFTYTYFINTNTRTMRKIFNDAELAQILSFYETPVGKKWIQFTPQIIAETMQSVQKDLNEKLPKLIDSILKKK